MLTITNEDNMTLMARYPNKYFDLEIVDPPYGSANIIGGGYTSNKGGGKGKRREYDLELWSQIAPTAEYFNELFRVSKNQIIFGANHFIESMPKNSSAWIVWDKQMEGCTFADCELAWTSFDRAVKKYTFRWRGMLHGDIS